MIKEEEDPKEVSKSMVSLLIKTTIYLLQFILFTVRPLVFKFMFRTQDPNK